MIIKQSTLSVRSFFVLPLLFMSLSVFCQPELVKGVWLTNVASNALDSRQNIRDAVKLCAESGINSIYVVVWNRSRTLYPSSVMREKFGIPIMERFADRDPLKEILEEAHVRNIKVHAWFEFGFASSYQENGGMILKKYPQWAALNREGKLVSKNGFEWMNAFLPEVQSFLSDLMKEVVLKYPVDGIQGDDRFPANPSEAGYDPYTISLYKSQHNGQMPPSDSNNPDWINWRADLLTDYLGRIYRELKSIRPELVVSMAPSIHPWAKEHYLQDWPRWMELGIVDYVCPQVYRYNFEAYSRTLSDQIKLLREGEKSKFFPGVLLQVNGKSPSEGFLDSMIVENRKNGIKGECFFFFEGLKKHPDYFKKYGAR